MKIMVTNGNNFFSVLLWLRYNGNKTMKINHVSYFL